MSTKFQKGDLVHDKNNPEKNLVITHVFEKDPVITNIENLYEVCHHPTGRVYGIMYESDLMSEQEKDMTIFNAEFDEFLTKHFEGETKEVSCRHEWKQTVGLFNVWKDCSRCGAKGEEV